MGWKGTLRATEAAERRHQRDAQRRLRELERQSKEQAKLSAMEKARLEVETFENQLEVLLSVHKEQGDVWDWTAIAASLPPPCPQRNSYHEQKARQRAAVRPVEQRDTSEVIVGQARLQDEEEFENATRVYSGQMAQVEKLKNIARRVLAGEHKAYTEAVIETENATALENKLHKQFLIARMNKINLRKEFFRVGLNDIRQEVEKLKPGEDYIGNVIWTEKAKAAQFYDSHDIETNPQAREK